MKKTVLGGLAGGIILFVWGTLAWVVLPIHDNSIRSITDEDPVLSSLQAEIQEAGLYMFPGMPEESSTMSAAEREAVMAAWTQKYQRGPIGMIVYNPRGADPFMASQMIVGLILNILSALLAAWLLVRSTAAASSYVARIAFCGMLGLLISVATHLMYWNWMSFPADHTSAMIVDTVIGWVLAGVGIGAVVKSSDAGAATA